VSKDTSSRLQLATRLTVRVAAGASFVFICNIVAVAFVGVWL